MEWITLFICISTALYLIHSINKLHGMCLNYMEEMNNMLLEIKTGILSREFQKEFEDPLRAFKRSPDWFPEDPFQSSELINKKMQIPYNSKLFKIKKEKRMNKACLFMPLHQKKSFFVLNP